MTRISCRSFSVLFPFHMTPLFLLCQQHLCCSAVHYLQQTSLTQLATKPIERASNLPRSPRRTNMTQHLALVHRSGTGREVDKAVGAGHDSVMYSCLERAADTVHWHAQNVPANVGRRYTERMGRRYAERMGQPHTGIVWAECHVSSALAKGCPY